MVEHRVGWLDPVFVFLTRAGNAGLVWLALALAFAVIRRRPETVLLVAAADGLAELAATVFKGAVGERRPPVCCPRTLVAEPHSSSFPSGHATTSVACATVLALLLPRYAPAFALLAAAIAFSRVYVGVHYPLDIAAGAALGAVIGVAVWLAGRRLLALRARRRARASARAG